MLVDEIVVYEVASATWGSGSGSPLGLVAAEETAVSTGTKSTTAVGLATGVKGEADLDIDSVAASSACKKGRPNWGAAEAMAAG